MTPGQTAGIAELETGLLAAAGIPDPVTGADVAERWHEGGIDPERDVLLSTDADGSVVGWCELDVATESRNGEAIVRMAGGVSADHRSGGRGTVLLEWAFERAQELVSERWPGKRLVMQAWERTCDPATAALLGDFGFTVQRWFSDMELDVATAAEPAREQERIGATVDVEAHAEAIRACHNDAFLDHWGADGYSADRWARFLSRPVVSSDWSRVVVDPESGLVDAYVITEDHTPEALHIAWVGTRREARGRGLAGRLIREIIEDARVSGVAHLALGVDADSPTGAGGVYVKLGFASVRSAPVYLAR